MQRASMNTPAKLHELLVIAGFESVHVWGERVAHQWTLKDLLAVQVGCGMPARRLASLAGEQRERCQSRVKARLECLTSDDLVYRAEVLLAVARRPVR
jgi:hypothetical protein